MKYGKLITTHHQYLRPLVAIQSTLMDNYSSNFIDSLKVFYLLNRNIASGIHLLCNKQEPTIKHLAHKCLYIDLCSFIDELRFFVAVLHKEDIEDLTAVNRFLLTTQRARKILNKKDETISLLRNTIYAHNYRNKEKHFIDPLTLLLTNYQEAPIMNEELVYLGNIAILVGSLALRNFQFNANLAFSTLKVSSDEFKYYYPEIEAAKNKPPDWTLENLKKDIYYIEDSLKSNQENYSILAKKIKCKIRHLNSR